MGTKPSWIHFHYSQVAIKSIWNHEDTLKPIHPLKQKNKPMKIQTHRHPLNPWTSIQTYSNPSRSMSSWIWSTPHFAGCGQGPAQRWARHRREGSQQGTRRQPWRAKPGSMLSRVFPTRKKGGCPNGCPVDFPQTNPMIDMWVVKNDYNWIFHMNYVSHNYFGYYMLLRISTLWLFYDLNQ